MPVEESAVTQFPEPILILAAGVLGWVLRHAGFGG